MCANLVGAARKCARESGSRAARNLKKMRAKFAILNDMVKRESLAEVRKTIPVARITSRTSQHNSRVGNHLPNIEK